MSLTPLTSLATTLKIIVGNMAITRHKVIDCINGAINWVTAILRPILLKIKATKASAIKPKIINAKP